MHKKRDCNLAVPLIEALVLPFVPNNNTEAHAVCICTHIRVPLNTYHRASLLRCFGTLNLPDSDEPKQSA